MGRSGAAWSPSWPPYSGSPGRRWPSYSYWPKVSLTIGTQALQGGGGPATATGQRLVSPKIFVVVASFIFLSFLSLFLGSSSDRTRFFAGFVSKLIIWTRIWIWFVLKIKLQLKSLKKSYTFVLYSTAVKFLKFWSTFVSSGLFSVLSFER